MTCNIPAMVEHGFVGDWKGEGMMCIPASTLQSPAGHDCQGCFSLRQLC